MTLPPCDEFETPEVPPRSPVNDDPEIAMGFDITAMMETSLAEDMMDKFDMAAMQAGSATAAGFDITTVMEPGFCMPSDITLSE
jgi:hypothetical protein